MRPEHPPECSLPGDPDCRSFPGIPALLKGFSVTGKASFQAPWGIVGLLYGLEDVGFFKRVLCTVMGDTSLSHNSNC